MLAMPWVLGVALQAAAPVAFVDVAVLRGDAPGVRAHQTVLVEGDRIAWVGPAAAARLPAGTVRIDGRGRTLLPGFADMHVHVPDAGALLTYVANGITTVRNLWGTAATLALRDSTARGLLLGPRVVTAGAILEGTPPSQPGMTVLLDPAAARAEVARQADAGYDFIKVYNSVPAAVYDSLVLAARARGLPVAGHVPFAVGLHGALRSGQRSIEHLRGYIAELVPAGAPVQPGPTLASRTLAWNHVDTTRVAALVAATVRAGTWNCPTLMVTGELLAPPEQWAALAARPALRFLGAEARVDRARVPYLKEFTPQDYRDAQRGVAPQRQQVRALFRAGAGILAGTDSYLQGFALREELRELEAAGLTRWEVLQVATAHAARFLGEADAWGVVAAGARADLQLVEGDPLASLDALDRRAGVMVRGAWWPRAALAERLEAVARAR